MNINTQRKIDRILGTIICRILSILNITKRKTHKINANPNKILIILLSEMGSLVLAYPMFSYLKKKYPNAKLYALLLKKNRQVLEIIDFVPTNNIFTLNDNSFISFIKDSIKAIFLMRKMKIDTVVDCELFARISSIFSFLSGAKNLVGFHPHKQEGLYRGDFINRPVLYNPYIHISQQFVNLACAIEAKNYPTVKRQIELKKFNIPGFEKNENINKDEISNYKLKLLSDFPEILSNELVLIYPGGGLLPIRAWPLEYYLQLSNKLIKKGYVIGIIGLASDKYLAKYIKNKVTAKSCYDLTGYTKSVSELMLLFHLASLLITNDGGPGHFATMTPLKTIIFYGPETPVLYGPLSDKSYNFYSNLSCSPCLSAYNHRNSPCDGDNVCLTMIKPEKVIKKAYEMLKN